MLTCGTDDRCCVVSCRHRAGLGCLHARGRGIPSGKAPLSLSFSGCLSSFPFARFWVSDLDEGYALLNRGREITGS